MDLAEVPGALPRTGRSGAMQDIADHLFRPILPSSLVFSAA